MSSMAVDVLAGFAPTIGALDLAAALGLSRPTAEQAAVVEHLGPTGLQPTQVVAGAGSGKTETMAMRVVWLVVNGINPERILGLTFTTKAATELAERISDRLEQARHRRLQLPADLGERMGRLADGDLPSVSTYNAYAAGIVSEHGLRIGLEPGLRVCADAERYEIMSRIVQQWDAPMDAVPWDSVATLVGAVVGLAGQLGDHLGDVPTVQAWLTRHRSHLAGLSGKKLNLHKELDKGLDALQQLLPLVERFAQVKRRDGLLDFSDQVAMAARLASLQPVQTIERNRYDVVLLDEYQDTGFAQATMLMRLFAGRVVMSVGDPCQAIYGWRGAGQNNLPAFRAEIRGDGLLADRLTLSQTFRNGGKILAIAEAIAAPLREHGIDVVALRPCPGEQDSGVVEVSFHADKDSELTDLADRIATLIATGDFQPSDVAVLCRTRKDALAVLPALAVAGVPAQAAGMEGLLLAPEVRDVEGFLSVAFDPGAGAHLARMLTGRSINLGIADLKALGRRAKELAHAARSPSHVVSSVDSADGASLVEALSDLGEPTAYSADGLERLRDLASRIALLRERLDQPLADLVGDAIQLSGVGREAPLSEAPQLANARLARLVGVVADFEATNGGGPISLLAYFTSARDLEGGLSDPDSSVIGNVVTVMTVHGAKGLEWPVVAVPSLVDAHFPSPANSSKGWVANPRALPFPLRGDREGMPVLDLTACPDNASVRAALDVHKGECDEHHLREERRLAYVGVTRAAKVLLLSGHRWDLERVTPCDPSPFLIEARNACCAGAGVVTTWQDVAEKAPAADVDVALGVVPRQGDPVAQHSLESAAALVRAAMATNTPPTHELSPTASSPWADVTGALTLLLRERDDLASEHPVLLPQRLGVTDLVRLHENPASVAAALRRPLPRRPGAQARRGSAFHAWVETFYSGQQLLDLDDDLWAPDELDDSQLEAMKDAFRASSWAAASPVGVEVAFTTVIGGVVVRGRMDAVFPDNSTSAAEPPRYLVIDWKTGAPPSEQAAQSAAVQLAIYRSAWAALRGVPLDRVSAAFHYVLLGRTWRPADLLSTEQISQLIESIPVADPSSR